MISRRLTKTQKNEILEAYRAGENTNSLAEKYSCTTNTINRTVKNLLSDSEYTLLKGKRSKINHEQGQVFDAETLKANEQDLKHSNSSVSFNQKSIDEDLSIESDSEFDSTGIEESSSLDLDDAEDLGEYPPYEPQYNHIEVHTNNQNIENNLELIEPLNSSFDFDQDKQSSDFEILHHETLPESVYMIVDKKVELEFQLISDLPEWSFLPENELKRNAILLFSNQRSAKRSCSRNQRVIKIPDTSIFEISKSYLISKGITRLILEDSIISLDN